MISLPGISETFALAAGLEERLEPEPHLFIPYHDRSGTLTGHYRWRCYNKRANGQKYYQEPGSPYVPYFCHLPLQCCKNIFLTEGEKKELAIAEAGYQAIGLAGLSCYQHDANNNRQIIPELYEAIRFAQPATIYFVGDADTVTNLEYTRSAHFLALMFPAITVRLLQVPLGGPKGIDDLRGFLDGQFSAWFNEAQKTALVLNAENSFLVPALLQLQAAVELIGQLPAEERERHINRIVQMAALAQLAKEEPFKYVARFCEVARKATGLTKPAFGKALQDEIRRIMGPDKEDLNEDGDEIAA
jgi:hypothetical protein